LKIIGILSPNLTRWANKVMPCDGLTAVGCFFSKLELMGEAIWNLVPGLGHAQKCGGLQYEVKIAYFFIIIIFGNALQLTTSPPVWDNVTPRIINQPILTESCCRIGQYILLSSIWLDGKRWMKY
jgi:hypothetical protein